MSDFDQFIDAIQKERQELEKQRNALRAQLIEYEGDPDNISPDNDDDSMICVEYQVDNYAIWLRDILTKYERERRVLRKLIDEAVQAQ